MLKDLSKNLGGELAISRCKGHPDFRTLPKILAARFRNGYVETGSEAVLEAPDHPPFFLQGSAPGDQEGKSENTNDYGSHGEVFPD